MPISYELKSELEKQAILESYKLFLRTCNFDMQILIQSKNENIDNNIKNIVFENHEQIDSIKKEYMSYIKKLNSKRELSSKNFFILINIQKENLKKEILSIDNIKNRFAEKVLKIEDTLSKCGNKILEVTERKELTQTISSFINPYVDNRRSI